MADPATITLAVKAAIAAATDKRTWKAAGVVHDEITRIQGAKEEGIKEGIIRTARNMLIGNIDIQTVKKVTGLTTEELEEIKRQLN